MTETLTLSGYDDRKELLAQRYNRAGKSLFVVSLPLHLISSHLPIPDPAEPFEGNRRVNETHAARFGEYWRANVQWATPPLLLDTMFPLNKEFKALYAAGGVEFGVVKLPHNSSRELDILDGQHRILGWKMITDRLLAEVRRYREDLQRAREIEDEIGIQQYAGRIAVAENDLARLRDEYITLEILEGVTKADHKQYFHDITVNAKGISKSVTMSFDRRNVINRVALTLAEQHPLLVGRVDFEKDRTTASNENLVSGKNLVDIVRHVVLGIDGRMTLRREKSFKESAIEVMGGKYLDALMESFPQLDKVANDELHPVDLRQDDLLGSATILRVLAGAYYELAVDTTDEDAPFVTGAGDKQARQLFALLAPHTSFPIEPGWFGTGYFESETSRAPGSRAQQLRGLTDDVTQWGQYGKVPF
jgi:hypothetical protein